MILERFIVLEGLDGNGKSTVMPQLAARLRERDKEVQTSAEPTDTETGQLIRAVLHRRSTIPTSALPLLFAVNRYQHLFDAEHGVVPYLRPCNHWSICSRYVYSSFAYQQEVVKYEFIARLNRDFPRPQFLFYIDLDPAICLQRLRMRGANDILEQEQPLRAAHARYQEIIAQARDSETAVYIIDGEQPSDKIARAIMAHLAPYL